MTNASLARWFGRQLDDWTPSPQIARLYGLTINDPALLLDDQAGAARFIAVADGDPYDLLSGPGRIAGPRYDAVVLVAVGWVHRHGVSPTQLTTVMVVTVTSLDEAPAFYVRDPTTGQEIEVRNAVGELPAAVHRLSGFAA